MRRLTDAHKASLAAGRKRRADALREAGAIRAALFCDWSEKHATAWQNWQTNCGLAQHDCDWCLEYRQITSAIPALGRDEDFDYAREGGLID